MALRRKAQVEEPIAKTEEEEGEVDAPSFVDSEEAAAEEEAEQAKIDEAKAAAEKRTATGTGLATRQNTAVATTETRTSPSSDMALSNRLEGDGYGGLDDGFGAYPVIALKNEGVFEDNDQASWGDRFVCCILGSVAKYVVANTKCEKRDEEVVYTFDQVTDTQGRPIEETISEWAEKGWGYEIRPYTDVMAEILEGERAGEVVILSLPKTSRTKYTGYIKTNMRRYQAEPKDYKTEVYVGDKITSVDFPYYPWRFKYAGGLDD